MVTDDGDEVYMRVLFMVFCQMSKSERSPEHPGKGRRVRSGSRRAQVPAGHTVSLAGGGHQEENSAGTRKPRGGRPQPSRRQERRKARRARVPSTGERTDPSAGRCGAFSVRPESPGPESLICGAGLRLRRLSPA